MIIMRPFIKLILRDMTNVTMESDIDFCVSSAHRLLLERQIYNRDNKISYIIVSSENGILFTRVVIQTVRGYMVHDKENTTTYYPEMLMEGIMNYVNKQKNTDFVLLLDHTMESFNNQLFIRLKETRIKIKTTEVLISRKIMRMSMS